MKHLVIGASGQVGEALCQALSQEAVIGTYNMKEPDYLSVPTLRLDVSDSEAVNSTIKYHEPDIVWLTAAMTHVDRCEFQSLSHKVNILGPKNVIDACNNLDRKRKPVIVFFSTDYLFDGKDGPYDENAIPNPLNRYGMQKLQAEHLLSTTYSHFIIIRTCWVYGPESQGKNFVTRLVNNLKQGKSANIRPEISCPTYAPDLAKAAVDILKNFKGHHYRNGLHQVINIAGPDFVRKDLWAKDIANKFNCNPDLIITDNVMSHELNNIATRPNFGGLSTERLNKVIGRKLRSYNECLEEMYVRLSTMPKECAEGQRPSPNPEESGRN